MPTYRAFDVNEMVMPTVRHVTDDLQAQIDALRFEAMYAAHPNDRAISDDKWLSLCNGLLRLMEERIREKIDISTDDFLSILHGGNS